jgi:hypothetical protein
MHPIQMQIATNYFSPTELGQSALENITSRLKSVGSNLVKWFQEGADVFEEVKMTFEKIVLFFASFAFVQAGILCAATLTAQISLLAALPAVGLIAIGLSIIPITHYLDRQRGAQ